MKRKCSYILIILFLLFGFSINVRAENSGDSGSGAIDPNKTINYCGYIISDNLAILLEITDNESAKLYEYKSIAGMGSTGGKITGIKSSSDGSKPVVLLENNSTTKSFSDSDSNFFDVDFSKKNMCPSYVHDAVKKEGWWIFSSLVNEYTFSYEEKKDCTDDIKCNISLSYASIVSSVDSNSGTGSVNKQSLVQQGGMISLCDDVFKDDGQYNELHKVIKTFIDACRVLIPLGIFVLSAIDFAIAVFSNEEMMKKVQSKFIRRLIIAVAFFIAPNILILILNLANTIWPNISTDFCGLL